MYWEAFLITRGSHSGLSREPSVRVRVHEMGNSLSCEQGFLPNSMHSGDGVEAGDICQGRSRYICDYLKKYIGLL